MKKEELYPTEEEMIKYAGQIQTTPEVRWQNYRNLVNSSVDNAVKKIVEYIEKNMELERCDPDVMAYFTDFYWIPKDVWQDKIKELIE